VELTVISIKIYFIKGPEITFVLVIARVMRFIRHN